MGKIEKIIKKGPVEGQTTEVYPVTSTKAVYDENNKRLDNIITGLQESVYLNNTLIDISLEDVPESNAQNVKNIADYVEKAKAAGVDTTSPFKVFLMLDGYPTEGIYDTNYLCIYSLKITDDGFAYIYAINIKTGKIINQYEIVTKNSEQKVTSSMLVQGARNPIILTPDTTEVDEETYQKLLSDDVDVVFKASDGEFCTLTYTESGNFSKNFYFSCFSCEGETLGSLYIYAYIVSIATNAPHTCTLSSLYEANDFDDLVNAAGYLKEDYLNPVLQEINLSGTDAERKAKLDQFAKDWKTLTGASDLNGARFVGSVIMNDGALTNVLLSMDMDGNYSGISMSDDVDVSQLKKIVVHPNNGSVESIPLFSHLEAVEIFYDDSEKQKNLDNLNAYKNNLKELGVDTTKGFQVPFTIQNSQWIGSLFYTKDTNKYIGFEFISDENLVYRVEIDGHTGQYSEIGLALDEDVQKLKTYKSNNTKTFESITLKAGNTNEDMAANVATIKAYIDKLKALGVNTTKGFMVSVNVGNDYYGYMASHYVQGNYFLSGTIFQTNAGEYHVKNITINPTGRYDEIVSTAS